MNEKRGKKGVSMLLKREEGGMGVGVGGGVGGKTVWSRGGNLGRGDGRLVCLWIPGGVSGVKEKVSGGNRKE